VRAAFVLWLLLAAAGHASAQVQGHVSLMFDALPDLDSASGNQHVSELRARVFAERADDFGEHLRIVVSGYVDGLVADRASVGGQDTTRDVIVRPADVYADLVFSRFDVRIGAARIVWGRLDEFQPTDVVNPLDVSRFFFEGRSEARLPAGLGRVRYHASENASIEGVFAWARARKIVRVMPGFIKNDTGTMLTLPGDPLYPAIPDWEVPEETRFVLEEGARWQPLKP